VKIGGFRGEAGSAASSDVFDVDAACQRALRNVSARRIDIDALIEIPAANKFA
jgi:hypothetical protein